MTNLCSWFSLTCYLVCVKPATIFGTATVNPIASVNEDSRQDWKLLRRPMNLEQQQEWTDPTRRVKENFVKKLNDFDDHGTVIFSTDKCSRYCIEQDINENEDNFQYINLFWTANGIDVTGKDYSQLLSKREWTDAQNSNMNPRNCQIYLDLDCNIVEVGTTTNYAKREFYSSAEDSEKNEDDFKRSTNHSLNTPIKLAEKYNLSEQTQIKFLVDSSIHRIIINIDGNISNALLQIPTDATVSRQRTTISWTSKADQDGVRIDTRNAPPGEWRMKLEGVEDSKYRLAAEGFVDGENYARKLFFPDLWLNGNFNDEANIETKDDISLNKKIYDNKIETVNSEIIADQQQNLDAPIRYELVENKKITRERSLKLRSQDLEEDNDDSSIIPSSTENVLINFVEYVTFVDENKNVTASTNTSSEKSLERLFSAEEQEKLRTRPSVGAIENLDVDIRTPMQNNINISTRMIETVDNREQSEKLVNSVNKNGVDEKRMLIEVNKNSNLLVTPGTIHRIVFDVTNNCVLPVRYAFRVKSTPFRLYNVQPLYAWIYPGQMSNVAIDLIVPDNATPDTANTVTLFIVGTEIKEKSAYLYVQGSLSKLTDDVKPRIEYSFNNNCAGKLDKDRCYKSRWSVDITIQDYDSGLKRVISSLNDIYPRTEFISGATSLVTFYYTATCCDKAVKITAIDLLNNYNTITIDVTEWNNLSEAEIAAFTVGALLILLFIVLIVILIIYCFRRRKSHDLPYTQRYGSRAPAHSERTNF